METALYEQSLPQSPQSGSPGVDELQLLIRDGKTTCDITTSDTAREIEPTRRARKAGFIAAGSTLALGLMVAFWVTKRTTQATFVGTPSHQNTV
eukprot:CAMPEP_0172741192 /NCGR_PEP_ID=MMETSP1074-20121228/126605_1 /TAXON_ID=2916 /ORGANISM="Ceratium fusus, Strain PA161109" /LENGTH=93 /DNA_ID=CAMNT_0013571453 /DNA_START=9 /DNA_END=287 /DNA_ORIENTATION=+